MNAPRFPRLFSAGTIGSLRLPNRLIMSPMSTKYCTPDGAPTERLLAHYRARAQGGVGLVICEYAYVDNDASKASPGQLGVYDDGLIPSLARLADTIKLAGARAAMQISHCGRQKFAGDRVIAPSSVPWDRLGRPGMVRPQEATLGDIERIVEAYGLAALRVKQAGFDLVEVHGGHGYLVSQFLSARTNLRIDRYGGSPERRMRFLIEVIDSIRSHVGSDFPVSVRLSQAEFIEGGYTLEDTCELARQLERSTVSAIHISAGVHESTERQIPPMYHPLRSNVEAARLVKAAVGLPVLVVGGITSPDDGEMILESGAADFITLGRALLADPQFPRKAFLGRIAEIRPCIRCNDGCLDRPRATLQGTQCSVNFAVGREDEFTDDHLIKRSARLRRVVVVGGGPGGMEAARIAARRGHSVTLLEQASDLGGWLRTASVPDFKADLRRYLAYLRHEVESLGIDVRRSTVATTDSILALCPDAVVLATGSFVAAPAVPGVVLATDVLAGTAKTRERVVVVGSDQAAIDTALYLADQGRYVHLIHENGVFGESVLDVGARHVVMARYKAAGIVLRLRERPIELRKTAVATMNDRGIEQEYPADTIVISGTLMSADKLRRPLELAGQHVWAVGDCVTPRKIYDAVHEAHIAALRLDEAAIQLSD